MNAERYPLALEVLKSALVIKTDSDVAYNNVGFCHYELEMYEESASAYLKATEINAENHCAFRGLGRSLNQLGQAQRGMEMFGRGMFSGIPDADIVLEYAKMLCSDGQVVRAYKVLTNAAKLFPKNQEIEKALQSIEEDFDI